MTRYSQLLNPLYTLVNRLLPTRCLLCACRLPGDLLCTDCELALPHPEKNGSHACLQCALPLYGLSDRCGHCLNQPPDFEWSIVPFVYDYPLDYLIRGFKYRRQLTAGRLLGQHLLQHIHHTYAEHPERELPSLIVPVPLHWRRRLGRGFNQAEVLGQSLSQSLQLPLATHLCRRQLYTPAQQGLNRAQRQHNLSQAFTLSREAPAQLADRCIALVDDVVTTTSTARILSRLLREAGAREVHLWALARTPPPPNRRLDSPQPTPNHVQ